MNERFKRAVELGLEVAAVYETPYALAKAYANEDDQETIQWINENMDLIYLVANKVHEVMENYLEKTWTKS